MANDGGHLILDEKEKGLFIARYPITANLIRKYVGAAEFIEGWHRYCFWLVNIEPRTIKDIPELKDRLQKIKEIREHSSRPQTIELASVPTLFGEIRQPEKAYLAIPKTSSERRTYIPIGFLPETVIANTELFTIPDATPYHFGILTSAMHMAWVRQVCGRLKSDYRYSAKLVYNNFPWPVDATAEQKSKVETCAQTVLDVRQGYLDDGSTLADLYDPLYMPAPLLKAHQALDKAVDRCYRKEKFANERDRVEYLFQLYEQLTAPLAAEPGKKKRGRKNKGI